MTDYRTILVPYDFSEHADAALSTAVDVAGRLGADCHLLHIVQPVTIPYGTLTTDQAVLPPPNMLEIRESASKALEDVAQRLERADVKLETHVIEASNLASAICEMASKLAANLIVMGTHGRTGIAHVFLGSVAERTLRDAPCPVLTVRAAAQPQTPTEGGAA